MKTPYSPLSRVASIMAASLLLVACAASMTVPPGAASGRQYTSSQ
ncbi:hypothetical protein SAMN05444515_11282 [Ectothiorhodospira marina]|uniref:Uncharacterized protein n=1 Tax=Ectothiorhodospira marina TaxID=1396821 RepID=A0A1H7NSH6_9GAMM|nr:hypothetical protein SAMN05444515_11282 [Ectothiorhodospira marina]